ncbi:hypothetical protein LTR66_004758 [Elasticomyces elasticus]|nr:hypothetical protein LTR28_002184 [Elasticomyces elasticus]KAK4995414.1 hypothetical protein LTR66_004758 [Elasticomyces elasticus]
MPLPEPHPAFPPPGSSTYYRTQGGLGTSDELDEPMENQTRPHALPLNAMLQGARDTRPAPQTQDEPNLDPLPNMSTEDMRTLTLLAERCSRLLTWLNEGNITPELFLSLSNSVGQQPSANPDQRGR